MLRLLAASTALCSAGVWLLHALVGYLWHLPCWQASLQLYPLLCLRQAALFALRRDKWDMCVSFSTYIRDTVTVAPNVA